MFILKVNAYKCIHNYVGAYSKVSIYLEGNTYTGKVGERLIYVPVDQANLEVP